MRNARFVHGGFEGGLARMVAVMVDCRPDAAAGEYGMVRKRGFTLIELLVVIAIIALLVSILLPSLQKAKQLAISVKCSTNERSICQAIFLYGEDWNQWTPPLMAPYDTVHYGETWNRFLASYYPVYATDASSGYPPHPAWVPPREYVPMGVFNCPLKRSKDGYGDPVYRGDYGLNHALLCWQANDEGHYGTYLLSKIKSPSELYLAGDVLKEMGADCYYLANSVYYGLVTQDPRHMSKCNIVFFDQHVASLSPVLEFWDGQLPWWNPK
jgi:prepilin-type N-terminal cleavage/methylation domain-containing protein/prepilin-type processing-associated H-X9-DG protein